MYKTNVDYLKRCKRVVVSIDEMNDILKQLDKDGCLIEKEPDEYKNGSVQVISYWEIDKKHNFGLYTSLAKKYNYRKVYITCSLVSEENKPSELKGLDVFAQMQRYHKIRIYNPFEKWNANATPEEKITARALQYINPKYDGKELQSYVYDLNSAYGSVLCDKFIDTYRMRKMDEVKQNEVGFLDDNSLTMVHEGYADYVFPLIESPYKKYMERRYAKKKNAKTEREKKIAKEEIIIGIGMWYYKNPFARAYVVNTCNEKMQNIISKYRDNIIKCNTDAIYSTVRIPECEKMLGDEMGQFKMEHEGMIRYKGHDYQVVGEIPHKRGTPKKYMTEETNILEDTIEFQRKSINCAYYDENKRRIIRKNEQTTD